MLPRAGKEFLVRIQFSWRPFFQGRYLLLTNTLSGGGMLALGDILQQSRETRKEPGRVRDWKRTGKRKLWSWEDVVIAKLGFAPSTLEALMPCFTH